eukprot:12935788-Prorocentrum_lima.AAC.1
MGDQEEEGKLQGCTQEEDQGTNHQIPRKPTAHNQKTSGTRSWRSTKGPNILSRLHRNREQLSAPVLKE